MSKQYHYVCKCGYAFQEDLGAYGCPNCEGDYGAANLKVVRYTLQREIAPDQWANLPGKHDLDTALKIAQPLIDQGWSVRLQQTITKTIHLP